MPLIANILVGVDLATDGNSDVPEVTEASRQAIQQGIWLAERTDARITFMAILPEGFDPAFEYQPSAYTSLVQPNVIQQHRELVEEFRTATTSLLQQIVDETVGRGCTADFQMGYGSPWLKLLKQAITGRHDLVIVGSRELPGIQRLFLGSTAMKLIRKCPMPIWVAKPGRSLEVKRVLAATDFSQTSRRATLYATDLAALCYADLDLVHAFDEPITSRMWSSRRLPIENEQIQKELLEGVQRRMAEEQEFLLSSGAAVKIEPHLKWGNPGLAILQVALETNPDLLVLGSVGRGGLTGVFLGNTADRVMRDVDCPLLVVKPEGFVCPTPVE